MADEPFYSLPEGSHAREVALLALGAAVASRRAFSPSSKLTGEEQEVLLGLGLAGSAEDEPKESARGLAALLFLDVEDVLIALENLRRDGLVGMEPFAHEEEIPDVDVLWRLKFKGERAVERLVAHAAKAFPSWPPAAPLRGRD